MTGISEQHSGSTPVAPPFSDPATYQYNDMLQWSKGMIVMSKNQHRSTDLLHLAPLTPRRQPFEDGQKNFLLVYQEAPLWLPLC